MPPEPDRAGPQHEPPRDGRRSRGPKTAIAIVAGVMVFVTILPLAYIFDLPMAPLMALLATVAVVVVALRR
jgi:hypothetical protein